MQRETPVPDANGAPAAVRRPESTDNDHNDPNQHSNPNHSDAQDSHHTQNTDNARDRHHARGGHNDRNQQNHHDPGNNDTDRGNAAPGNAAVRFDEVSLSFSSRRNAAPVTALDKVSFEVGEREFCAIVGPSGCGKSTLLNLVAGLTPPSSGSIEVHGRRVAGLIPDIGYVTQDSNLLPWLTVDENIRLPLQIRKLPAEEQDREVERWIEIVGLGGFRNSYPHQLSGGMQKRCSIARTLVYNPPVLLMDEPFGALDAMTKAVMQDTLLDIWDAHQKTVLFVTHDLSEALTLADRVIVMSRRPGRVKAAATVEIPRPRDVFHISELREFAEQHRVLWDMFAAEISTGGLSK